ncbi:MAG TPA: nucleotide exchange factor GrpE [Niabella sp.]|nr:nucleotide exchange factor GrpE [Niabella sp.]HOZ98192.1 nucleotide exchange factor GrpE [Niabella sp.]HQW16088.1 nucleotide exchange factor GrpE [Niabella sp.]HQX21300.1 nucleotide exchange factor GrpE [Niabella sp.]HQX42397.1 nucleotide exchange factor GrpE [Niabella sp.]
MSKKEQENLTEQEEININADENVSGTEHLTDPLEESQLETLENELKESKDKYIRLAAEFDNFRKRTAKERLELFQTAAKDIVVDLLDVLDDVDRASREFTEVEDGPLKQGVNLVFNKFRNVLQSKGVKQMNAIGTEFDPELHEAITEIAAPQEDLKGKVIDEITKGYYLNDKIIRHTKVVVGK